ncbi:MAG TPA: response regulator [Candidatus Sulfotelmatobacter sp.]
MPQANVRLLIVDDEPSTRMLLSHIFTELGHSVRSAEDGFSALFEIRQEVPDVILSDLNMPGMSGFEFLSVVRRRFPEIHVIAMSGAFSGDGVQPGVAADAFYEKATGLRSLLQIVEAVTHPERPTIQLPSRLAPIWIQSNGHDPSGEAYVVIACPECLRTFPQVLGKAISPIRETACVHCSSLIHYAIVQPMNPAAPQVFQRKPGVVISMPLSVSALNQPKQEKEPQQCAT